MDLGKLCDGDLLWLVAGYLTAADGDELGLPELFGFGPRHHAALADLLGLLPALAVMPLETPVANRF